MNKTQTTIVKNEEEFPEFKYYLTIIDKIEENVVSNPDISIESCKSLLEGISKTILKNGGVEFVESGRNIDSPKQLVEKALKYMEQYIDIEVSYITIICDLVERNAKLRNARGDISHGRSAPKNDNSDFHLSEIVKQTTDNITYYILSKYFMDEVPKGGYVKYEDNEEFNDFLSEQHDMEGIKYSLALFDQDPVAYREQLNNYLLDK